MKNILSEEIEKIKKLLYETDFAKYGKSYLQSNKNNRFNLIQEEKENILEIYRKKGILREDDDQPYDYTRGKKKRDFFTKSKIGDIVKYVMDMDKGQPFVNNSVYRELMTWFLNNDSQTTRNSLSYWVGNLKGYDPKSDYGKSLDPFVVSLDKSIEYVKTKNLPSLLKSLEKYKQTVVEFQKNQIGIDRDELSEYKSFIDNILNSTDDELKVSQSTIESEINNIRSSLSDSGTIEGGMSSSTKMSLLNQMSSKLTEKFGAEWGNDKKIQEAYYVAIVKNDESYDTTLEKKEGEKIESMQTEGVVFQYPDPESPDALNLANNFFQDDSTKLKPSGVAGINKIVQDAKLEIDELRKSNCLLMGVTLTSYASTSQVNSRFGKVDDRYLLSTDGKKSVSYDDYNNNKIPNWIKDGYKFNPKFGESIKTNRSSTQNNIPLCDARGKRMIEEMRNQLNPILGEVPNINLSKNQELIDLFGQDNINAATERILQSADPVKVPNNGPGWDFVGGEDLMEKRKLSISDYGPLFQEAYKITKGRITPRSFYGARNQDAATAASSVLGKTVSPQNLVDEYEKTYAKYRVSTCVINLIYMCPKDIVVPKGNEEVAVVRNQDYQLVIYWDKKEYKDTLPDDTPRKKRRKKRKKVRRSGGSTMFIGGGNGVPQQYGCEWMKK
jgi:hypothetical protein